MAAVQSAQSGRKLNINHQAVVGKFFRSRRVVMAKGAHAIKTNSDSAERLRKSLEQSLAALAACEEQAGGTPGILQNRFRSMPLRIDPLSFKKRALNDAATALAALWKTSRSAT
jgi:hypothetical protein